MNALEYFREVVRKNPDIDIIQVNKAIDFFCRLYNQLYL